MMPKKIYLIKHSTGYYDLFFYTAKDAAQAVKEKCGGYNCKVFTYEKVKKSKKK